LALLSLAIATSMLCNAQNLNLNISAQAGYDNTIITSFVDSNGNPLFLSGGGTSTLTISGATTPLVLMIAGVYQQLITSPGLAVTNGSGSPQLQFVYVLQDIASPTLLSTDFATTTFAPIYSYIAPTGATGQFWFDLSTNLMKSWNGSMFVATPAVFIGVIDVAATGNLIDAVLCEPYRLNPYRRVELFGTGVNGAQKYVNAGMVTAADGWQQYSVFEAYGPTTVVQPPAWTAAAPTTGLIIFSQNPVLVLLGASINANTKGAPGGTGGTGLGNSGQMGGCAGAGGGGGFDSAGLGTGGGNGGGRSSWAAEGSFIGAGVGGSSVTPTGTRGQNATIQGSPDAREVMPLACMGAGGGAGAGDSTHNGGAGGSGGGVIIIRAPSILLDSTPSIVTAGGQKGVNGSGSSAGGGGGGGGTAVLQGIFVNQNGTLQAGGGGAGTGGNSGGGGGAGFFITVKLQ
jgi:hypothetical protein